MEPDLIPGEIKTSSFAAPTEPGANELRYGFLSQVSEALSESLDYSTTLRKIARLAVPALADWCAVDRVVNETIEHIDVTHVDSAKADLIKETWARYPPRANDPLGVPHVVRSRQPELHFDVTPELL